MTILVCAKDSGTEIKTTSNLRLFFLGGEKHQVPSNFVKILVASEWFKTFHDPISVVCVHSRRRCGFCLSLRCFDACSYPTRTSNSLGRQPHKSQPMTFVQALSHLILLIEYRSIIYAWGQMTELNELGFYWLKQFPRLGHCVRLPSSTTANNMDYSLIDR